MPEPQEIRTWREGPLAWVEVNRPAARNAMNLTAWEQLAEAVTAAGEDRDARVLIVRGAGEEAFIAGADISEFRRVRANAEMSFAYDQAPARAAAAIIGVDKPVVAMVNGHCYGGGCSVLLAADLRLAAEHARFAVPAARLGLAYPMDLGIERLVAVVGPTWAAEMLLAARVLSAPEAMSAGLVSRVLPGSELAAFARDYALQIAELAPLTLAAHKRGIQESMRGGNRAAVRELAARCFDSADYREGVAAFLEKRKPRFEGR